MRFRWKDRAKRRLELEKKMVQRDRFNRIYSVTLRLRNKRPSKELISMENLFLVQDLEKKEYALSIERNFFFE